MRRLLATLLVVALAACGGSSGPPTAPDNPIPDTFRTIKGTLRYFTTGPSLSQFDADGRLIPQQGFVTPTIARPAPRFSVEVLDLDDEVIGTGTTNASGQYTVLANFGPTPATQVRIRSRTQLSFSGGPIVRVRPADGEPVYSNVSEPGGQPANREMQIDLTIPLSAVTAPYFMLETLYDGILAAKSGTSITPPPIDILHAPGNGAVSSFVATPDRGIMTVAGGITGVPTSNQDGWDPPVVARLLGNYVLSYFVRDTAPQGMLTDEPLIPSVAWREGFLDFWSCFTRNSRFYWDTNGIGADGRVVRYFDIESFFDPALGSLGPNDPNVYQDPALIGVGSRYTVAEMLWDIHDSGNIPIFVTLGFLEQSQAPHPYLITLLDSYTSDGSLDPVDIQIIASFPENQGFTYPVLPDNPARWPRRIYDDVNQPTLMPPEDRTVSDHIDDVNPGPLGIDTVRYFGFTTSDVANAQISLTTSGTLRVELYDDIGNLLASGTNGAQFPSLPQNDYVIIVRTQGGPQNVDFDLRLVLTPVPA